jgi:hypothetical protein
MLSRRRRGLEISRIEKHPGVRPSIVVVAQKRVCGGPRV